MKERGSEWSRGKAGEDRHAHYRALLGEQERSGQSLRAFAAARGLSAWTLYGWRRRLGQVKRELDASRGEELVPVELVGTEATGNGAGARLEVVIGARRILVPPEFDEGELERVIGVLERC